MIMVIFGAGASYDSVQAIPLNHSAPYRPPLADQLFRNTNQVADSLKLFPECFPVVPILRSVPRGKTVEQVLQELQAEGEKDSKRQSHIAAIRFYLQRMIWDHECHWRDAHYGITNYVALIDQLRRSRRSDEPALLVTFNYDEMIEQALSSVHVTIKYQADYIQHDTFKLYKLHGSIHWFREIETPIQDTSHRSVEDIIRELISIVSELKITNRYRMTSGNLPVCETDGTPLFPAIAIPVEVKSNFECPADHLESLREHLGKVTKILVVGWKGAEQHFLKELKDHFKTKVSVQVVAGNVEEARNILTRMRHAGIDLTGDPIDGGFTNYVVTREAERFLGS